MKNINSVVPHGQSFQLSSDLFLIEPIYLDKILIIGTLINRFMSAMQAIIHVANLNLSLGAQWKQVRNILFVELNAQHRKLLGVHPQRNSQLVRVDFMVDEAGELKIAEIDPMNKHGLGFALLCRNENGHGERQKILSLFSLLMEGYESLAVVISRKDEFFFFEQAYFAEKLSAFSGKPVRVISEEKKEEIKSAAEDPKCCILDCPVLEDAELNQKLLDAFMAAPKRFLVPPKHWMANKALMAFSHEPVLLEILHAFLGHDDISLLQKHIPPTFTTNPKTDGFVVKKVLSSGAKGVFFNGNAPENNVVYQQYVPQKMFLLEGTEQYVRLAAHFVGTRLGELTVTSSSQVPVHGNSESVNYHVGLKEEPDSSDK